MFNLRLFAFLAAALVISVSNAQPNAATNPIVDGFVKPNANLYAQGIPPIPAQLVADLAKYGDFRGVSFVGWHPSNGAMLVRHRAAGASTTQLHWLPAPGGGLQTVTEHADPVTTATIERQGKYLVYTASAGGSEAFQLFRQDLDKAGAPVGKAVQITNERERHARLGWYRTNGRSTGEMLIASVPLDRFLPAAERDNIGMTLRLLDPLNPGTSRALMQLPQTGWSGSTLSKDGNTLYMSKYLSANESEIWAIDLAKKSLTRVLPAPAPAPNPSANKASYRSPRLSANDRHLLFISDRTGEFRELMRLNLASGAIESLTGGLPHDVEGIGAGGDSDDEDLPNGEGEALLFRLNVNGQTELRALDARSFKPLAIAGLPTGNVASGSFKPRSKLLALNVNGAQSPGDVWTLDMGARPQTAATLWAKAGSSMDTSGFRSQEVIRWKSFDGLEISGLISRASQSFTGKRPVLIDIHGGPESQARVGFAGRQNHYTQDLGITVIRPNVRGSSGFGKTFLTLDNGFKREDSVKDIGALLDWIAQQPGLDASRVLVSGGSYGGYMSLAVSTHYADRIAGAVDSVGISNFVTFLENTESYRRDLRRVEYGDERDPAMREHLLKISPLTNAHKITKPLFVIQGKNDPRVPMTEAEQIVAKVRANGGPVWYLRGENEGHGFARRENADFYLYSVVMFLRETILK